MYTYVNEEERHQIMHGTHYVFKTYSTFQYFEWVDRRKKKTDTQANQNEEQIVHERAPKDSST